MKRTFRPVKVLDLLLNRDNPRHVTKDSQEAVIEYLLGSEEVYNLARHMSRHGINPLEVTAVFPDEDGNLIVAEGNRRVCAAQLLTDPEKAPEKARARFKALSAKSRDVSKINIQEFADYAAAQPWLQVLHDGEQDGIGRRRWKPEQKARATLGRSTDALAVALLDYAEDQGIISAEMRKDLPVSTATRYLANPAVRNAMGLASGATSEKVEITINAAKFAKVLSYFLDDLKSKRLHSRSATREWVAYAAEVEKEFGTKAAPRSSPLQVNGEETVSKSSKKPTPSTRAKIVTPETRFIARSPRLIASLNKLKSFKLSSLYESLISLELDKHPALLTTGAWVFVETLTALHGRTTTDFQGYVNGKMASLVVITKDQAKECRMSLEYIALHGNAQKHSPTFTAVDARNLNNHFRVLDGIFVALTDGCIAAKKGKP